MSHRTRLCLAGAALGLAACHITPLQGDAQESAVREAHAALAAAYSTCNEAAFVGAYGETFTFLTSNTPEPVNDARGLRRYLGAGCQARPNPTASVLNQRIRLSGDQALIVGQYLFRVPQGGQTFDVPQNFTLVMQRSGPRWLVVAHHVSVSPRPAAR